VRITYFLPPRSIIGVLAPLNLLLRMDVLVSRAEFRVPREDAFGHVTIHGIGHLVAEAHDFGRKLNQEVRVQLENEIVGSLDLDLSAARCPPPWYRSRRSLLNSVGRLPSTDALQPPRR
jgi:hypothetical protein